jgi:hypothetical protein
MLCQGSLEGRDGIRDAEVVRLADDDQQRVPLAAPRPQVSEHTQRGNARLVVVGEPADLKDHHPASGLVSTTSSAAGPPRAHRSQ